MDQYRGSEEKRSEKGMDYTGWCREDWHTHTIASGHGTSDRIVDLAKAAGRVGLEVLGISDHGPASMGSAGLSYFRSLSLAPKERLGVALRYGVESNILNVRGDLDVPDEVLQSLDYGIISMHRPIYVSGSAKENTFAYLRAMEHPKVRIIGHCDDSRFPVDYRELVRGALAAGVLPELNNVSLLPDSYRQDCRNNAIRMLQECVRFHCPIILSSDSHGRGHVGDMTKAWGLVQELHFPRELIANATSS